MDAHSRQPSSRSRTRTPCRSGARSRLRSVAFLARVKNQSVSVQIADAELPASVERIVDVLHGLDSRGIAGLSGKRRFSGVELTRFQKLVKSIDPIGVEPEAHVLGLRITAHAESDLGLSEGDHAPIHDAVFFPPPDFAESDRGIPIERLADVRHAEYWSQFLRRGRQRRHPPAEARRVEFRTLLRAGRGAPSNDLRVSGRHSDRHPRPPALIPGLDTRP